MLNGTGSSHIHPSGRLFHNPPIDTINHSFEPPWPGCLACAEGKRAAQYGVPFPSGAHSSWSLKPSLQLITDISTGFDLALSAE